MVWCLVQYVLQTVLKLNIHYETYFAPSYEKIKRQTSDIKTSDRRVLSTIQKIGATNAYPIHGRCEMDSHADTTVAGRNCAIIKFTDSSFDVSQFSDKYTPIKDVPIVLAATGYTFTNRLNYILIFKKALKILEMTRTNQSKSVSIFWSGNSRQSLPPNQTDVDRQ